MRSSTADAGEAAQRRRIEVVSSARANVVPRPLGVVGIIVPWNYPLFLAVSPLVGALVAGNRAMVKSSEFTTAFSELLQRLIAGAFRANEVPSSPAVPTSPRNCCITVRSSVFTADSVGRR